MRSSKILRKASGDHTMVQKKMYKWRNEFKEGPERAKDEPPSKGPIKDLMLKNSRLKIRDFIDSVQIPYGSDFFVSELVSEPLNV